MTIDSIVLTRRYLLMALLSIFQLLLGCGVLIPSKDSHRLQLSSHLPSNLSDHHLSQLSDLSPIVELDRVPFFPQAKNRCGSAALATVLRFRGVDIVPSELDSTLYIPSKRGTLTIDIIAQTRQRDRLAYQIAPRLLDLFTEVSRGQPVLVLQNLGLSWIPQWHYSVVVGYNLQTQEVVLRSGRERRRKVPLPLFDKTWARAGRWGLIVPPLDKIPVTAEPVKYLSAVAQLEEVKRYEKAKQAYQLAAKQWPAYRHRSYLGLANIAFQEGRLYDARDWLSAAIHAQNNDAFAWNNLGFVLQALNCPVHARMAVECAAQLAPELELISASRRELNGIDRTQSRYCADYYQPPTCSAFQNRRDSLTSSSTH